MPYDNRVNLLSRSHTASLYATDTLSITPTLHLTLSGRYNRTEVVNRDQINPGGGTDSLDGDHRFSRFNPAIGLSWAASPALGAYAGYSEGSRTPTAIELDATMITPSVAIATMMPASHGSKRPWMSSIRVAWWALVSRCVAISAPSTWPGRPAPGSPR